MTTITREEFIPVYVRMVKNGNTCAEIGEKFGLSAKQVSLKASQYRQQLKSDAMAVAKSERLDEVDTANLVDAVVSMLPTVTKRTRTPSATTSLMSAMNDLLAACDADPADEGAEENTEETTS